MSPERSPASLRRWLRWAGTLATSVLFIWLLARQDWAATWQNLSQLPYWIIPLALSLYYAGMLANALRWHILLSVQRVPISFSETAKIVFAGAFVSNFLPSTIGGDALRIIRIQRCTPDSPVGLASIIVDRLLNVLAMLATFPMSWITFGAGLVKILTPGTTNSGLLTIPLMAVLSSVKNGLDRLLDQLRDAVKLWQRSPGYLALAFGVSWLSIFVIFVGVWLVANGLGIRVALYQVMGVNVLTYLMTLLPVSVNGYGLREVLVTTLYMQLGASLEQAATLAITTRFFMLLETLPGVLWLGETFAPEAKA